MGNRISIPIGTRYGRLVVLGDAPDTFSPSGQKRRMVFCYCDCGRNHTTFLSNLRTGHGASCGCIGVERRKASTITHGKSKSRVYNAWKGIIRRCQNLNCSEYHNYGGRGISVSNEWQTFENFYRDMGDPPVGMSIDRIDNNKGYSVDNCRWANPRTQSNNRRNTIRITFDGQTKTISDWSKEKGIKTNIIRYRLRKGWKKQILFKPLRCARITT